MKSQYHASDAPNPVGNYPHSLRVGDLLFLSGIGPRQAKGDHSGIPGLLTNHAGHFMEFDFEAQVHAVFKNVESVLQASGADWHNLVDITVFLTDMQRDFQTFNRIYGHYFREHKPCRTTVEVSSLPTPIAIELKCIAYLGEAK